MKATSIQLLPLGSQFVILRALGPSGGRVIRTTNQWLSCSGPEWTANRLKALRTAALQLRAGNHDQVRDIYRQNSIAYRKSTMFPRGPYGYVFKLFVNAQRPAVLRRIESVLRVYTSLQLTEVSQAQADKAKTAITAPYQGYDWMIPQAESCIVRWVENHLIPRLRSEGLVDSQGRPRISGPTLHRLKAFSSTHRQVGTKTSKDLRATPYGSACLSLSTTTVWPEAFMDAESMPPSLRESLEGFGYLRSKIFGEALDDQHSGHISFIQERGCKGRVVAVPTAALQWGFAPLHDWLDAVLQLLPASCVHDHNSGAYWLSQMLESGEILYSYDLSSATDRFPRQLQTAVLKALNLDGYADALDEVATFGWYVSSGPFEGEVWEYTVGQPMGLYGSFPLFALTHYALVCGLGNLGIHDGSEPFRLLGDDVIISSDYLAKQYRYVITSLGVDISATKTVKSSKVAEFAGFVGYRTNKSVATFRPYKHGTDKNIHNPVNLLHSLGGCLGRTGSSYWKEKVEAFQRTKAWRNPDLSPLICQDEAWGVNPRVLDTNRLSNLLWAAYAHPATGQSVECLVENSMFSMEDLAVTLLGKQSSAHEDVTNMVGAKAPDQLLSTPECQDDEETRSPLAWDKPLRDDPLMQSALAGKLPSVTEASRFQADLLIQLDYPEPPVDELDDGDSADAEQGQVPYARNIGYIRDLKLD